MAELSKDESHEKNFLETKTPVCSWQLYINSFVTNFNLRNHHQAENGDYAFRLTLTE